MIVFGLIFVVGCFEMLRGAGGRKDGDQCLGKYPTKYCDSILLLL